MSMQTQRWTELLQLLRVTITRSHSHVGSRALGEVRHRLVNVFLWQHKVICRATFSSSAALSFGWSLWYFSITVPQTWYM